MRRSFGIAVLLLFAMPLAGWAEADEADGSLKLLDEVAKSYADASTYHLEWETESRSTSELMTNWSKQMYQAEEAPKSRYRFQGETATGEGVVVSDGATEYDFHRTYNQFIKRLPDSFGHPFPTTQTQTQDFFPVQTAFYMKRNLGTTGATLKSAHFLDDETITVGGHAIKCAVVTYGPEDLRRSYPNNTTYMTYWIDTVRKVIVKSLQASDNPTVREVNGTTMHEPARHLQVTTTYTVIELNKTPPEGAFAYTPPEGAELVAEFPAPPAPGTAARPAPAAAASIPKPAELVGRLAPLLTLHNASDGSELSLTSLRGHPVLVDLWATWCGPCLVEMPLIDRIYRKTKDAGLVVLGMDSDEDPKMAVDFLKRKSYDWPDYHEARSRGFPHLGIPTMVLIDASGKMVYYHTGNADGPGLLAAIRQLDPALDTALKDVK
jgi:cytochrome c biogenesis protein CcmG/thiol:disulfide interchange protein DsbE